MFTGNYSQELQAANTCLKNLPTVMEIKFNGQLKENIDLLKLKKHDSKSKNLCLILIMEVVRMYWRP